MFAAFLQKIFFKDVKVKPHPRWVRKAEKAGRVTAVSLSRVEHNRNKTRTYDALRGALQALIIEPNEALASTSQDPAPCQCMADTLVVLAHPIHKKAKYFFTETGRAQLYLSCGATVLLFDFNGFGESRRTDLFYWRDVLAALAYVKENFPHKKVRLHGVSFGAFHVIRACSALPLGSTLVLENVNRSLISYWKRWPLTYILVGVLEALRVPSVKEMNVQSFMRSLKRPDLSIKFLACEKDTFTTVDEMRELFSVVPVEKKTFTVFNGASHLMANAKDKKLYQRVLKTKRCQVC